MKQLLLRHEKFWNLILEVFNYFQLGNTKVVRWIRDSSIEWAANTLKLSEMNNFVRGNFLKERFI